MEYKDHPLSSLLPLMGQMELKELAADIQQNGLRAPITLLDGKILDGRNRYRACQIVSVTPRFREFNGDGDPVSFIVSANVKRRHLSPSQRSMVAAKLATMPHGGNQSANLRFGAKTVGQAADELEVSPRSVTTAKKVLKDAPKKDIAAIEKGEKTVNAVAEAVAKKAAAKVERPAGELDKTGFPIPDSILEDWQRATETARQLLSQISDVRSEVKHGLDDQDVIYAEINNTTLADLTNAYTSIKCVVPYSVCTSCQGHHRKKCTLCRGRGFISEFAYRSYVPEEIKAIRIKAKR